MKNLLTTVFAVLSVIAFGQTPNYASYNWQRGQTFQDTTRFNDTIFTANDGNSTQWDSAYSVLVGGTGDIDGNGQIQNSDINSLEASLNRFNSKLSVGKDTLRVFDLNGNGALDYNDFYIIQYLSGTSVGSSTYNTRKYVGRSSSKSFYGAYGSGSQDYFYSPYFMVGNTLQYGIASVSAFTTTNDNAGTLTFTAPSLISGSKVDFDSDTISTSGVFRAGSGGNSVEWDSAYVAANQAVTTLSEINPNSQPIADQFFARARDSVASTSGYVEYYNQVNSDISRLMNLELTSGRTAYQDATIVFSPAAAYTSATPVIQPYDGSADFTFARSSTATRVDWKGIIEKGIAANLARYDFIEDSQEPALLLEPARANLLLRSEEFDNAAWSKASVGTGSNPVVTANAGIAPDGTTTADRIVFDASAASGDRSILRQLISALSTTGKHTVYVKSYDGSTYHISGHTGGTTGDFEVGNEWVRIDFEAVTTGSVLIGLEVRNGTTSGGMADLLVWGFQSEDVDTYPTSYMPTTSSTVTRAAESLSKTGIAALLGDSEGTIYFEGSVFDADGDGFGITLSDGTVNNRVFIGKNSVSNTIRAIVTVGGVAQFDNTGSNWVDNTTIKIALKYAANDFALWVNGVELLTDISGSTFGTGTLTRIGLDAGSGVAPFYGNVKALEVWDTALTDPELAALTTP